MMKARNRILALCIPLCLILTVWSVAILPAMLPANDKNMSAGEGNKESANEAPEDDAQTIYSLARDKLINKTTKRETVLTADHRSNLLNMLGLTIIWEEDPK